MVDWYVVAECEWLGPNFGQSEYIDMNGYGEGTMSNQDIQTDGEVGDPFLSYGIDSQSWAFGQAQMEIGLIGSHRIRINSSGVRVWTPGDVWVNPLTGGTGFVGYTDEQAVQAVEDAGLVLSSGNVITSANEDLLFTFGKMSLGANQYGENYVALGYRDFGSNQYALLQSSNFDHTYLNSELNLWFRISSIDKMQMTATALIMSIPIAMGSQVFTSNDTDLLSTFGRGQLGFAAAGLATFGYRGHNGASYGISQNSSFRTYLKSATGQEITMMPENTTVASWTSTALTMSIPIAMGGNDISSSGALALKVSADNDDYLQFYTSLGIPRIKVIGDDYLIIETDDVNDVRIQLSDDATHFLNLRYSKNGNWAQVLAAGGGLNLDSDTGAVNIRPSNDIDDYLQFHTSSEVPRIKIIGGDRMYLESDDASLIILDLYDGTYNTRILHTKSNGWSSIESDYILDIKAGNTILFRPSGDNDDYIEFSTPTDVPTINFIGGNGKITNVADPTNDQDVATKKYHLDNSINNLSEDASPQLGGDLDLNGKTINCNGNLGSDHTFEGLVIDNITNAQAFGKLVYITSAHTTALCDKDSVNVCIGISVGTGEVLYSGTIRDDSFSGLVAGNPVYVGDDGNPTDDISAYTTGDMVQCVGVAIDTNVILIKDICWVEVA